MATPTFSSTRPKATQWLFEGWSLSIRLTAGLQTDQDVLLIVRPEKALALNVEQARQEPLMAGWNEVAATVTEVLFLGES